MAPSERARRHYRHGTPIEEAPLWMLAIFTALLWLIAYPALVGLLYGWGAWRGSRGVVALAALGIAVLVTVGAASRKPWRRPAGPSLHDPRPLAIRFSTWLITALLLPNLAFGVIVLTHEGPPLSYQAALLLGLLISGLHGLLAWSARLREGWRRRRVG